MSSIKDSLTQSLGAGAGELAFNLIDRLKKTRSDSSSNLISNFANNIEKKLTSSTKLHQISLSKLLDDDDKKDEPELPTLSTPDIKLEKSQSEINSTTKKPITTSISLNTNLCIEKETLENSNQSSPVKHSPEPHVEPELFIEPLEAFMNPTTVIETPQKPKEEEKMLNKKHILLSVFVLLLSVFIIKASYTMLIYTGGVLTGVLISGLIFFLLVKFDFLKYFEVKKLENNESNELKDTVQCLLIQSAVRKENNYFDGVYKGWMN